MSTRRLPEPSGPGLRELRRIQDERLAEVVRVCGDCKHYSQDEGITCRAPLPVWVYNVEWNTMSKRPTPTDWQADHCECFERKDAK